MIDKWNETASSRKSPMVDCRLFRELYPAGQVAAKTGSPENGSRLHQQDLLQTQREENQESWWILKTFCYY